MIECLQLSLWKYEQDLDTAVPPWPFLGHSGLIFLQWMEIDTRCPSFFNSYEA